MSPSRTRMTRARARQTSLSRGPAPVRLSPPARLLGQRRLTDARPALDDQHPAAARQQQLNRGQLTLALAQPPHQPACRLHSVPSTARRGDGLLRPRRRRSEEHTSELQSHVNLVCRLLLEKKKKHHKLFLRQKKKKKKKKQS